MGQMAGSVLGLILLILFLGLLAAKLASIALWIVIAISIGLALYDFYLDGFRGEKKQ